MKSLLNAIVAGALCFTYTFGALPESGTITIDSSVTGDILIFNGAPILPEEYAGEYAGVGQFGMDATMNHNSATGQITGTANFTADFSDVADGSLGLASAFNMNGSMKFSAKVTKTGAVTRLVGAKATISMSGNISDDSNRLNIVSSLQVDFRKYEVDTSQSPILLNAVASVANLKLRLSGVLMGQRISQSLNQTQLAQLGVDLFEDIDLSTEFPEENLSCVEIAFGRLTTSSKGAVSGTADSILDVQDFPAAAYKVSGKRDVRTGVSKISLGGQVPGARGTSAVIFVDDNLQVQRGARTKNVVKAYGYTVTF